MMVPASIASKAHGTFGTKGRFPLVTMDLWWKVLQRGQEHPEPAARRAKAGRAEHVYVPALSQQQNLGGHVHWMPNAGKLSLLVGILVIMHH